MITILCGKVAAGKSFLAREAEQNGALVLSCDELMLTVFDHCLGEAHNRTAAKCLHYLFSVAERAAHLGLDVWVDYGFWLRSERDAARTYFRQAGLPFRILLVTAPDALRRQRLSARNEMLRHAPGRVYLIEGGLLDRLDSAWEPIAPDEQDIESYENLETR